MENWSKLDNVQVEKPKRNSRNGSKSKGKVHITVAQNRVLTQAHPQALPRLEIPLLHRGEKAAFAGNSMVAAECFREHPLPAGKGSPFAWRLTMASGAWQTCERCCLAAVARAHANVSFGFARVKKIILMSVMAHGRSSSLVYRWLNLQYSATNWMVNPRKGSNRNRFSGVNIDPNIPKPIQMNPLHSTATACYCCFASYTCLFQVKPIRQLQANVEEYSAYAKDPDISTALGL